MDVNISFKRLATALLLFLGFCVPALAQSDPAPIEIGGVTFSGNIRERYEAWNFFEPTAGSESLRLFRHANPLWNFANAPEL